MSLAEQWNYLRHIVRLVRSNPEDLRFFFFCLIGVAGMFVNMLALTVLINIFPAEGMAASIGASVIAMLHNYILNDRITWRQGAKKVKNWRRVIQMFQFFSVCSLGTLITALIVRGFLSLGWSIYIGQIIGIATATWWNFSANEQWTWSHVQPDAGNNSKPVVTQEYSREIY